MTILEKNPDIKLVVLTSPTYEGVISNIKEIAKIVHLYSIPLLIDEAHGAHIKFTKRLKEKEALESGADIVIQSLHKTLPALTQTAVMHVQGKLVKEEEIQKQLAIFQTSSPSYILMSSIDECLNIIEKEGKQLFKKYEEQLKYFYEQLKNLKNLKILGNLIKKQEYYDNGKIVIITENTNINGNELSKILREQYKIEVEMANTNYIIAMTSICDKKENFQRLIDALKQIDKQLEYQYIEESEIYKKIPKKALEIYDIEKNRESKFINYKDALGKIVNEYVWIYPPGIPIIAPGEVIDNNVIKIIEKKLEGGLEIRTSFNEFPNIKVKF